MVDLARAEAVHRPAALGRTKLVGLGRGTTTGDGPAGRDGPVRIVLPDDTVWAVEGWRWEQLEEAAGVVTIQDGGNHYVIRINLGAMNGGQRPDDR